MHLVGALSTCLLVNIVSVAYRVDNDKRLYVVTAYYYVSRLYTSGKCP
jgi:hypothetical protein